MQPLFTHTKDFLATALDSGGTPHQTPCQDREFLHIF